MNNEENKPKEYDLVLGGNNPPPVDGLVLGGIAGIKQRLLSNNIEVIKSALSNAVAYKDEGLELVINALYNTPQEIRQHAANILRNHKTAKAEQALLNYDPNSLFVRFSDWNLKNFNLESYLEDPVDTAYRIDLDKFSSIISELEKIEPQGSKIEALYLPMWSDWYDYDRGKSVSYKECIDLLLDAHQQLPNLKALFLADETDDRGERRWEYKRYKIQMDEVSYLLEAYPKLELLHLLGDYGLEFSHIKHNNLKTLVIEARNLSYQTWEQILTLDLPQLEYLELWIGGDREYLWQKERAEEGAEAEKYDTSPLTPLLDDNCFPNLKYLGICSCEGIDDVVIFLQDSPVIKRLKVFNLAYGSLTDKGAEALLNYLDSTSLYYLDLSMNILSPEMINKLCSDNPFIIANPQDRARYDDVCGYSRYSSLYE